ncbi:DUF6344 domain-containing protein [Streptomyces xanthophaeus]|uniref:DUF6344 domain-containing protein n=1 Tax=Streptomyces xanthophaeus TaxID=67385 RepID=UPI00398FF105
MEIRPAAMRSRGVMTTSHAASFWIAVVIAAFLFELFLPSRVEPGTEEPAAPAPRTVVADTAFAPQRMRFGAGALPPTLKQRVRAEAHGGLPAVRGTANRSALSRIRW